MSVLIKAQQVSIRFTLVYAIEAISYNKVHDPELCVLF